MLVLFPFGAPMLFIFWFWYRICYSDTDTPWYARWYFVLSMIPQLLFTYWFPPIAYLEIGCVER
jgi:hypothetical protein